MNIVANFLTRLSFSLGLCLAVALSVVGKVHADENDVALTKSYYNDRAFEVYNAIQQGNGWYVAGEEQEVKLADGVPATPCRKYYTASSANLDTNAFDADGHPVNICTVTFRDRTGWVMSALELPVGEGSTSSLKGSIEKAVETIQGLQAVIRGVMDGAENPEAAREAIPCYNALGEQNRRLLLLVR